MVTMDERYMRLALDHAASSRGQTSPNPLVGAVVVKDDVICGLGAHLRAGTPHAEVHALRMAGDVAHGATLYVTLEPCNHHGRTPPCTDAILKAGIRRVVVASTDANPKMSGRSLQMLQAAGIEVVTGVLEKEALKLNQSFFYFMQTGLPYVVWKWASTLDGRIAAHRLAQSEAITGSEAHSDVQRLRRTLPAIGVGIGTVLADNPRLSLREEIHQQLNDSRQTRTLAAERQPLRVVFDSHLRTPETARLLTEPGNTCIVTTTAAFTNQAAKVERLQALDGIEVVAVAERMDGHLDLKEALRAVGQRGCHGLLLEGGSILGSAFLSEQIVNEVVCYLSPILLGGGVPATEGRDVRSMTDAIRLKHVAYSSCGEDIRVEGVPDYSG